MICYFIYDHWLFNSHPHLINYLVGDKHNNGNYKKCMALRWNVCNHSSDFSHKLCRRRPIDACRFRRDRKKTNLWTKPVPTCMKHNIIFIFNARRLILSILVSFSVIIMLWTDDQHQLSVLRTMQNISFPVPSLLLRG